MLDLLASLPTPSDRRIRIHVSADAERLLRRGHPWLYDQAIHRQRHEGRTGDLAIIFDRRNKFLAIGLYDARSPIRVRILQHRTPAPIDRSWFQARLASAAARRESLRRSADTTGYRLVHGENDGLPGLVVDRYEDTLVLKLYTAGWLPHLRHILDGLASVCPASRLVLRLGRRAEANRQELHGWRDGVVLIGPPLKGPMLFREHGLRFEVDPRHGQKTGFFLDQRDNRVQVEQLSDGRSVLDAFAYTGAFSVYAVRGGAREVTSLDSSRAALAAARRNMALNRRDATVAAVRHHTVMSDAFEALERLRTRRRSFDLVILDPPAFAKTHAEVRSALSAYARLTRLGLGVLHPGGILVASSCSSQVGAATFFSTVRRAAAASGRALRELKRTGHPLDHPIGFPEGAYLKFMFARVERV